MPIVKVSGGYLRVAAIGRGHPDHELPGYGHPDQGLPEAPIDPGFGGGIASGPDGGYDIPLPPPGTWPPPSSTLPIVPAPPGTPPGAIWPPIGRPPSWGGGIPANPARPDQGLPPDPAHPDQGLPPDPAYPSQGLPPSSGHPDQGLPSRVFWVVVGIPGVGWRYAAIDPSLQPGTPLPPTPEPK